MNVTRAASGEITVVLSPDEADDLAYQIAVTSTTDSDVVWNGHDRDPHKFPLHRLHGAILAAQGFPSQHACTDGAR